MAVLPTNIVRGGVLFSFEATILLHLLSHTRPTRVVYKELFLMRESNFCTVLVLSILYYCGQQKSSIIITCQFLIILIPLIITYYLQAES